MVDERYAGWQGLMDLVEATCSQHGIQPHMKPKNGYLAVDLPLGAPEELHRFVEGIEAASELRCQQCGYEPATAFVQRPGAWILKLCDACQAHLRSETGSAPD